MPIKNFSTTVSIEKAKSHDYLYHHTNFDTLLFILKDKNIRLSRIDKVCNDSLEYIRLEEEWWRLFYVACFTYRCDEDLYFWNEYGDRYKNIRIRFRNDVVFGEPYYKINEGLDDSIDDNKIQVPSMASSWSKIRNTVTYERIEVMQILYNDELASSPGAIYNGLHSSQNHAGVVKKEHWLKDKKECECRIRMKIWNMHPIGTVKSPLQIITHSFGKESIDIPSIHLPIDDLSLDNLEVTFSPYMDDNEKIHIKNKIEKLGYNDNVNIYFRNSSLTI